MITTFKGKKITGMLTEMPENEYDYDEETKEIYEAAYDAYLEQKA